MVDGEGRFVPTPETWGHLSGKKRSEPLEYREYRYVASSKPHSEGKIKSDSVRYHLLGSTESAELPIVQWDVRNPEFLFTQPVRRRPNALEMRGFIVDRVQKTITVPAGVHKLSEDLVVPPGYLFRAMAGTILDLQSSALIVSYSPLNFEGNEQNPVVVRSTDKSGQGLVVLGAGTKSQLQFVEFRGLRNPSRDGWKLPGAVTFYESPVDIRQTKFFANESEDALNIVRSPFRVSGCTFAKTASDAFDADFSNGTVEDSNFGDIGNDAVDVSGSTVELRNVSVTNAGDKGLSAGEASVVHVKKFRVDRANVGLASKDLSSVIGTEISLSHVLNPEAVYQKKTEFGRATMELGQVRLGANVGKPYLMLDSLLVIDTFTFKGQETSLPEHLEPQEKNAL